MKITIHTINGNRYEEKNITNVIERANNTKTWLVLKKKNKEDPDGADKDYLKVAIDQVVSIKYN